MNVRCGIGYDLHRLAEGRKLIIGGVEVPFDKGPVGHSDGDVLAHALCDALFGAAGLGDIGTHFPDSDRKWKGANSLLFLEHARKLLDEKRFSIEHIDAVVILERPKLGPHFPRMRARRKNSPQGQNQRGCGRPRSRRSDRLSRGRHAQLQSVEQSEPPSPVSSRPQTALNSYHVRSSRAPASIERKSLHWVGRPQNSPGTPLARG
jgi:2-C-methyl-D-erythritol 2,4-cyclodiphosphate synthase